MRAIMYMYYIPTSVKPEDYPAPSVALRKFAARIEYSCWVVPEGQMHRTVPVTEALLGVGAAVDTVRFDEAETDKILVLARRAIEREAQRIRKYIDASISTTSKKLEEARRLVSVNETNAAIRFQQTAINRARGELNDAESCAVAFDLLGDLQELTDGIRAAVEARASAFGIESKTVRAEAKAAVAATAPTGAQQASSPTLAFGSASGSGGNTEAS